MPADDASLIAFPRRPVLRVVETGPVGTYEFPPRRPSFQPADPGAVYLRTVRLAPDAVEALLALFQCEAGRTGDWSLHDGLLAARDGITEPPHPEPPCAA